MTGKPKWTPERLQELAQEECDCDEAGRVFLWAADEIEQRGYRIDALEKWSNGVAKTCEKLDAEIERLRAALREILSIGERHVEEATGRRIADFREAIKVAQAAMGGDDE